MLNSGQRLAEEIAESREKSLEVIPRNHVSRVFNASDLDAGLQRANFCLVPGLNHAAAAGNDQQGGGAGDAQLQHIVDCLAEVGRETGLAQSQVALAWLLQRPTVASVLVGASSAEQLESNLDAAAASLSGDQIARLDEVSALPAPYPHGLQAGPGSERIARPSGGSANVRVDRALGVPS